MRFRETGLALAVWVVFAMVGCGGEAVTPPKLNLSEQEKQQIKELDSQRQREWSGTKNNPEP